MKKNQENENLIRVDRNLWAHYKSKRNNFLLTYKMSDKELQKYCEDNFNSPGANNTSSSPENIARYLRENEKSFISSIEGMRKKKILSYTDIIILEDFERLMDELKEQTDDKDYSGGRSDRSR